MIKELEYKNRRERLLEKIDDNSITILYSAEHKVRSHDTDYPYRQDSHFYYLSGFMEDKSILVLLKTSSGCKSILFVEKKDKVAELWNGKRVGVEKAKKRFLVDEIYTNNSYKDVLKENIKGVTRLYYDFALGYSKAREIKHISSDILVYKNISPKIGMMRLIKSKSEIKLIKKAIEITKEAHHQVMEMKKDSLFEYEIQARLEYIFKKNGAYSDAYTSIVASGDSANTLHYISNNKKLKKDTLILIDAGCEYKYYASDITRTIPVTTFSKAQREIYDLVLSVEEKIIKMVKPNIKRAVLQEKSEELICKGLIKLGILKGDFKELFGEKKYKKYYPHGIGHWLGLDVHDNSPYIDENNEEILLQKGMVLTIEPAIYCSKDDKNIPKKYRGIGVRIEDDILVTKDGYENLSKDIKK